jgi:hypothetical protein
MTRPRIVDPGATLVSDLTRVEQKAKMSRNVWGRLTDKDCSRFSTLRVPLHARRARFELTTFVL